MTQSLKERLLAYLKRRKDWTASGELQRLVTTHTKYTASNATRRLRELVEENKLEVDYRTENGVQHAFYRATDPLKVFDELPDPKPQKVEIEERNGIPVAVMK